MPEAPRRPRVLVIDDDALIGRAIERMLKDCDVTVEQEPLAAAQRLADPEPFELILCDLHMPRMTATDVFLAAKAVDPALAERIVVITGGSTSADDERFLRACGARVLYKPFQKEELEDVVAWAASKPRP